MSEDTKDLKALEWTGSSLRFIDQTALPLRLNYIETKDYREVIHAIKSLTIRGAPALGIAAGYAAVLAAQEGIESRVKDFVLWMQEALREIEKARPTARNLFFAIERMREILTRHNSSDAAQIKQEFLEEANRLYHEDADLCRRIGEFGAELIKDGDSIITHCNAGMLVTAGIGTALGVIFTAADQGKNIHVYADETRPLLQGARLTTWECMNRGVPVTLICNGAAAYILRMGKANCAIVGADRIAANGDVANKIGTYSLAVNCKAHNVPFYVAAPYSTFDLSIDSGDKIPIEERNTAEVTKPCGVTIAPEGVSVFNPAFDLTPAELVTAFITDAGIFRPPYGKWGDLKTV